MSGQRHTGLEKKTLLESRVDCEISQSSAKLGGFCTSTGIFLALWIVQRITFCIKLVHTR